MTRRLVLAAMLALALGCRGGSHPVGARGEPAGTAIVHQGDVVERVLLTGALHPTNAVEITVPATEESTLVIRWMIADGAAVKAGDRVLELDDAPFTTRLLQGRTQLASAETQFRLSQQGNAILLADKQFTIRQQEIARAKAELHAAVPADLVTERAAQDNAFRLAQAEADLTKAKHDLAATTEELALEERIKHLDLERTRRSNAAATQAIAALVITAPRDGVIVIGKQPSSGHKFKVGDPVEQGQAILSQPDPDRPMEVRAELVDVDDGRAVLHMAGSCTLDAYPAAPIACSIAEIAPVALREEGHGSLRRGFAVTLALRGGAPARLRPGMSVKIELPRGHQHGLVVPREAVPERSPARVRLGSGQLQDIVLGACDAQHCLVERGLAQGDVVAIGGVR